MISSRLLILECVRLLSTSVLFIAFGLGPRVNRGQWVLMLSTSAVYFSILTFFPIHHAEQWTA